MSVCRGPSGFMVRGYATAINREYILLTYSLWMNTVINLLQRGNLPKQSVSFHCEHTGKLKVFCHLKSRSFQLLVIVEQSVSSKTT